MRLFLILVFPLLFVLFGRSWNQRKEGLPYFFGGLLLVIPLFLFSWIVSPFVGFSQAWWSRYLFYAVKVLGYGGVSALMVAVLLMKRYQLRAALVVQLIGGTFWGFCLEEALLYRSWYSELELLLIPLLRMVLLIFYFWLLLAVEEGREGVVGLFALKIGVPPFLLGWAPVLLLIHYPWLGWGVGLVSLVGAAWMLITISGGRRTLLSCLGFSG